MSEREPSVTERFRKDLRKVCAAANVVDMSAPTGGKDRHWNADEFFAVDTRFFIVEFKSRKGSLKAEDRKESACILCGGLIRDEKARSLHDMAHFAAWGEKAREGHLHCHVGVYRSLVCNRKVLQSCKYVEDILDADGSFEPAVDFLKCAVEKNVGLEAKEFGDYLNWLLNNSGGGREGGTQKLGLFGFSYSDHVEEMFFDKFEDFETWAKTASIVKNATTLTRNRVRKKI